MKDFHFAELYGLISKCVQWKVLVEKGYFDTFCFYKHVPKILFSFQYELKIHVEILKTATKQSYTLRSD